MPEERRQERRRINYSYYRQLGYSARDARRLRDISPTRTETVLRQTQRRITRKTPRRRTPQEIALLTNIRIVRREGRIRPDIFAPREIPEEIPEDIADFVRGVGNGTREQRLDNFRRWSSREGFPPAILDFIMEINMQNNRPAMASFGFRVFYRIYVLGWHDQRGIAEVRRLIDTGQHT
jgi:hypothetical protein